MASRTLKLPRQVLSSLYHLISCQDALSNALNPCLQVRFGQVKRKLGIASEGAKSTPKKIAKTPGSRSGTKGKGGGRAKKEESHDEDNMDDTPTKSKHQPKHEDGDVKDEVKEEGKTLQEQVDDMIAGHPF